MLFDETVLWLKAIMLVQTECFFKQDDDLDAFFNVWQGELWMMAKQDLWAMLRGDVDSVFGQENKSAKGD